MVALAAAATSHATEPNQRSFSPTAAADPKPWMHCLKQGLDIFGPTDSPSPLRLPLPAHDIRPEQGANACDFTATSHHIFVGHYDHEAD